MAPIIYLILLCLVLVVVVLMNILSRTFLDKKNLVFFLPVLIILFCIYVTGYYEQIGKLNGLNYFECIKAAFDAFTFKIENKIVAPYMEKNVIYAIDVYFAATFAGLTVISGILGFFKVGIDNYFNGLFKTFHKDLDIVVGDPALAAQYVKRNKHSILWVDPRMNRLSQEDKKKYYSSKITYVNQPLNGNRVKVFTLLHRGYTQIICLQNDNKYLSDVLSLIDTLNNKRKHSFRVYVQTSSELLSFVDDKLSERCSKVSGVVGSSFDVYELITRRFSNQHNLAEYLPRSFFKDGAVLNDKKIKVVMLGFGKTSKAMFKGLVLNNQFVEVVKGKYQAKKVEYYLYDMNQKAFNDDLVSLLLNKESFKERDSKESYSELPCEIHTDVIDIRNNFEKSFLENFKCDENEFAFYFVSLKDGLENALIADKLSKVVDPNKSVVLYNVDNDKEALAAVNSRIIPFGYKQSVLSHKYICDERLWELSNAHNKAYNSYRGNEDVSYMRRPVVEKISNAYSVINYRFKLNILGFDFAESKDNAISQGEFFKVYDPENRRSEDKYENYFLISTRNAIAYQEHLRWATFYLLNGYTLLPLDKVKYEDGKLVHKDTQNKRHACLLPYYELDKLVKLEESLLPKGEDKVKADIYKYDFQSLDKLFETIEIAGYSIVRK